MEPPTTPPPQEFRPPNSTYGLIFVAGKKPQDFVQEPFITDFKKNFYKYAHLYCNETKLDCDYAKPW
jgi:hypothetical protein